MNNEFLRFAEDLLKRWEQRDAARVAISETVAQEEEVECLPCLIQDWDSDVAGEPGR